MPAQRTRDTQSRSLDVTTDAPVPPALSIIAPTPRAFTFPTTHNFNDTPSSSRSCSPDPDLHFTDPFAPHKYATVSIPTPSLPPMPMHRPMSPDSLRAPSPATSVKRRKSSASSEASERRPKKGDPDYIKRPENAFILFRRECVTALQRELEASGVDSTVKKKRQADLSKEISQRWKGLSVEERQMWQDKAAQGKKEHEEKYPNYVYRPQRNRDKDGRSKNKKSSKRGREIGDEPTISFVVPLPAPRHPRSSSAPTPPPYQSITIPQVVHRLQEPESPSDSLVHCISRVSTSSSVANNLFDFIPQNAYVPPPFPSSAQIDSSIQSPDFMMRNMFQQPPPPQNRVHGPSPLERLAMDIDTSRGHPQGPLASLQMSSLSSISSVSSSPASPAGPATPPCLDSNAFFSMPEPIQSLDMLHFPDTEADLALRELEENPYMHNIPWGWPSGEPAILDNNWDVNSIPPALMGEEALLAMGGSGKFADAGPDIHFNEFNQSLQDIYTYDELMSGTPAFATA